MARGGRLPRTAGRPPRFLRTGHQRAISLSEAGLQAARRDTGHTLGREAEGVLQSLLFHRASRGLGAQRATFRVLAEGDADVDAALASAVGCSPPLSSRCPPPTALRPERPCCARVRRCRDPHAGRGIARAEWTRASVASSAPGTSRRCAVTGAWATYEKSGLCTGGAGPRSSEAVRWPAGGWSSDGPACADEVEAGGVTAQTFAETQGP
jgi:hypothetical protein